MEEIYSSDAVARACGVSESRLYYAEKRGYLPKPKRWGGRKIYQLEDIQRAKDWFAAHGPNVHVRWEEMK